MKTAFLKDDAFLTEARQALTRGRGVVWWLGQSGFLVVNGGRAIVFDPYLSDSLTRKYGGTDKPHERITERVVAPAALGSLGVIDAITSSHNHTDHLDAETLWPLLEQNPQARLIIPAANREFVVERLGMGAASRLVELDDGVCASVAGIEFHGIAAAHNTIERDARGRCKYLGYVVRWGGKSIYHSGDTLRYEGMAESLRKHAVDLALLPINGNLPERRVAGNLDGPEAARLARDIGARLVIPCHFDMFAFNTASPGAFEAECRRLGQPGRVLRHGGSLEW
jgi:L-ascorbate metabolism protein UlaG (beta-lactamase superfamily)